MPSLSSPLASSPAEDLHTSRVQDRSFRACRAKGKQSWRMATWNVRSLVGADGSVETARQGRGTYLAEDWKADLVVWELMRYELKVTALQETLWFGSAVYRMGESVVLASGRSLPNVGESMKRGEGVAIVLTGPAIAVWRAAGEQWKAWSSRLVSAQLYRQAAGRLTIFMYYPAMHQPAQPAEQ